MDALLHGPGAPGQSSRKRSAVPALAFALGLSLGLTSACAPVGSDASATTIAEAPAARLDALTAMDRRVAEVAWRLALANEALCPIVRPSAGWSLHAANQYGPALREQAERRFGLAGDLPGLLAAPAGSPAALSGLAEGDVITTVNGAALSAGAASSSGRFDGLQGNLDVLDQAATQGPMALTVRRYGHERTVTVHPVPACAYTTQIETSEALTGRSDGRRIIISSGLAGLSRNDDELAFFLAHELAHAVLEHRTSPGLSGRRGSENSLISLRRGRSSSAEADADTLGLYLLARAGYAPQAAVEALTAYEATSPLNRFPQISLTGGDVYQSPAARRRALQPALADIARRRQATLPLIP